MSTITPQKKKQSFFREVINELKKVTWTTKEELLMSTKAVIIATFVFRIDDLSLRFGDSRDDHRDRNRLYG